MSRDEKNTGRKAIEDAALAIFGGELRDSFLETLDKTDASELGILYQAVVNMLSLPASNRGDSIRNNIYYPYLEELKRYLGIGNELFASFLNSLGGIESIRVKPNQE